MQRLTSTMSENPPTPFSIEPATPTDREQIIRLLAAQLAEHDIDLHADNLAHAVDGFFEEPRRGRILVARQHGVVVGVAVLSYTWTLEHGGKSCWLDELYVQPELRTHGMGTLLLHKAFEITAADGCIAMDLEVESSHARAANLYRREGFQAHTRTRYFRQLRSQ
jgi:GNAT superfamily N-acetyltransferase